MRRLVALLLLAGCDAPYVSVADAAVPEAATDSGYPFPDATITLDDGGTFTGHDEDEDGIPDDFDVCPGVKDPAQRKTVDGIGVACSPPSVGSITRAFFDPLMSFGTRWITGGPAGFVVLPEAADDFTGGTTATVPTDGGLKHGYLGTAMMGDALSTAKPLVLMAGVEPSGGIGDDKTGILFRASPGAQYFVSCYLSSQFKERPPEVGIATTDPAPEKGGCLSSDCVLEAPLVETPVSWPGWSHPALRVVATDEADGGGRVECTAFDADAHDKGTGGITVNTKIDAARWGGATRTSAGVFAQNTVATIRWVDVLVSK